VAPPSTQSLSGPRPAGFRVLVSSFVSTGIEVSVGVVAEEPSWENGSAIARPTDVLTVREVAEVLRCSKAQIGKILNGQVAGLGPDAIDKCEDRDDPKRADASHTALPYWGILAHSEAGNASSFFRQRLLDSFIRRTRLVVEFASEAESQNESPDLNSPLAAVVANLYRDGIPRPAPAGTGLARGNGWKRFAIQKNLLNGRHGPNDED